MQLLSQAACLLAPLRKRDQEAMSAVLLLSQLAERTRN